MFTGMNRGIYSAAMGMSAAERRMEVTANNLANASTDGYKADALAFGDIMTRQMRAEGGRGAFVGELGAGPVETASFYDTAIGSHRSTSNPLDVALGDPKTMFAVRDGEQTRFTRNGSFTIDAERNLVTSQGGKVLDRDGREIRIEGRGPVAIDEEGRIKQNGREVARLGTYTGEFKKLGANLWRGTGVRSVDSPIVPNTLEASNVNVLAETIEMIKINRNLDMAQRSITTHDESTGRLLTVLQSR